MKCLSQLSREELEDELAFWREAGTIASLTDQSAVEQYVQEIRRQIHKFDSPRRKHLYAGKPKS